ncbi:E3 ubiquitin/ISG15 ligase TRIM25-like [Bufo gargarizans]|uniref:E3 ubiquitin/ISG15 ligase TRIM25-like n=1 Tax=Bufo gargarizans TaxID=30331 RepID=UPI001CF356D0|nr:E3 ubiquitin/ISG15 ligase TRIM25-like [Bufo gargarizans]
MASADLRDELNCSVCLNIYTDPVTLSCGHNFCQGCINCVLDSQEEAQVFSCPECRAEFEERPTLHRNITLRNIAEHFRSTQPEPKPGVCCTYCLHSQVPALKSCLHCEASLCDDHLKAHHKSPEHVLSDLITNPEARKCSIHKKILEYYCSEDAACICVYCSARLHRGHKLEMLDEASMKKKERLRQVLETLASKKEKTEKRLQSLQERSRDEKKKASSLYEKATVLFRDLRRNVDDVEKKVLSEISRQEEQVLVSFSNLIHQLEKGKDELFKKLGHVEELYHITDPLTVLQEQESESNYFCDGEEDGGEDEEKSQIVCDLDVVQITEALDKLSDVVRHVKRGLSFQKSMDIVLDTDTAANNIHISDDLKTVSFLEANQTCPKTPNRFLQYQVLSTRSFSAGQHFFDVDTSDSNSWRVGMCYPSMSREGNRYISGENDKSWCLQRYNEKYNLVHNRCDTQLQPHCHRFRVCLDYEAGQLSFYELCDPIRCLHTFTATFTEPLHAIISIFQGSVTITN